MKCTCYFQDTFSDNSAYPLNAFKSSYIVFAFYIMQPSVVTVVSLTSIHNPGTIGRIKEDDVRNIQHLPHWSAAAKKGFA
jgi:hypothetical protein